MYEVGKGAIQLFVKSSKGYNRRGGVLVWTTILKVLREQNKVSRVKQSRARRNSFSDSDSGSEDEEEEPAVQAAEEPAALDQEPTRPLKKRR